MYSRDIVDKALRLHSQGHSDQAVANACGVSIHAVRHWRYGQRRLLGMEPSRKNRPTYCPLCHGEELKANAYSYLLGLYLGDGHIVRGRRDVYVLSVYCDEKYPRLMDLCAEAMEEVFPIRSYRVSRAGACTAVQASSKHWSCLFPQHGPGMKHTRKIQLEAWQQAVVEAHPQEFIKGLMHSDGCRGNNRVRRRTRTGWKYYDYPRYEFVNASQDIVGLLTAALDLLGIPWKSRIQRRPPHQDKIIIAVATKDAVARLDEFVGPKS
ncbi:MULTISPECIES: transcriptional regulator [unclassified Nocardiopsis]|uniref:transcriptional regulator n=1 Tax=Nocardiopsis TaxID=2013 RepID=UPI00387B445B